MARMESFMNEDLIKHIGDYTSNVPLESKKQIESYYRMQQLQAVDTSQSRALVRKIFQIIEEEKKIAKEIGSKDLFNEGKSKNIGVPINVDEKNTIYVNNKTKNGAIFPYVLLFPNNLPEDSELIVNTLNSRSDETTDDRTGVLIQGAINISNLLKMSVNAPIVCVFVPKTTNEDEPYYQQLSRECFTKPGIKYSQIDLIVRRTIEDAQQKIRNLTKKSISNKIVLNGYSTSGVFAQRFAFIHPDIVSKAIIGGAVGSIPMIDNRIGYPIGTKDYKELFNKEFDVDTYRTIDFAYYVGSLEAQDNALRTLSDGTVVKRPMHDMSYLPKSVPQNIGEEQRNLYGEELNTRMSNCIKVYQENGCKIRCKIYIDATHQRLFDSQYKYHRNFWRDILSFCKSGIMGTGFQKDESSAERIRMSQLYITEK